MAKFPDKKRALSRNEPRFIETEAKVFDGNFVILTDEPYLWPLCGDEIGDRLLYHYPLRILLNTPRVFHRPRREFPPDSEAIVS
ncbi:MAG: hypothetical protein Q8P52_02100 [bacterium]|nr:hypothetical protein [bacterium]